jgi:hypothetical protein
MIKGNAVKTAKLFMLAAAFLGWLATPALAQRLRTATPVTDDATASPYTSGGSGTPSPPSSYPPSTPTPMGSTAPNTFAPPSPVAAPPSAAATTAPTFTPGTTMGTTAPATGVVTQPPATQWDPFGVPCNTPSPLLSNDPCLPNSPELSMGTMQKFMEHVTLRYDYLAGNGVNNELGVNDTDLSATFAFPWFGNIKTPFLITPGFAFHLWSGPVSVEPAPPDFVPPADMPSATYDAYLDVAWNPQITESFGLELEVRPGVYSDFTEVNSNSLRVPGKGMAVIKLSPSMTVKLGVWYLDRVQIKMLPAGGIVWTPNPDVYFNILFPNPKIARKISSSGSVEWWLYGRGEYGGGTWTIRRQSGLTPPVPTDGTHDTVDYNDIRIAIGLDFKTQRQWQGNLEIGLSCDRQLVYASGEPSAYYPTNTIYFGAGLAR